MEHERRLVRLSDVKPKPIVWLWANRIPLGAITDLEGDPEQAKSTITYDLIARLTRGKALPNCETALPARGAVLLQAEDDLAGTVRPNLLACGADLDKVFVYDRDQFRRRPLVLPDDLGLIEVAAGSVNARLVIIDPLTAFFKGNPNSEQSVRPTMTALAEFAHRTNCAILLVRHLTKGAGKSMYRGAGSIAIVAAVRSALLAAYDPTSDDPHQHILAQVKGNLSKAESLSYRTVKKGDQIFVEWLGTSSCTAQELASTGEGRKKALAEASYVLYSLLSEGPVPAHEVIMWAGKAGVAKRTLDRAKDLLCVKSRKHGSGRMSFWTWQLPDDEEPLRTFKQKDIDDLSDRLCHGDDDDDWWRRPDNGDDGDRGPESPAPF